MPARPYKTSDYLLTAEDKAAYLNEALATEDPQLWET
jgi:DNA-binding phage protein